MKKSDKNPAAKEQKEEKPALAKKPRRKNSNASTRNEGRQRSGNNDPQQGSH